MHRIASSSDSHYPSSTESLLEPPCGTQRVKFRGAGPKSTLDYSLDAQHRPVDVSLVLPRHRARNQPLDHRMCMYVGNESNQPIKVKVCRNFSPSRPPKFRLEVHAIANADVTIWLPSDFKGRIHRSSSCKKVSFSAGFTNRIMENACLTQSRRPSVISISEKSHHNAPYRYDDIYISDAVDRDPCAYQSEKWSPNGTDEDEVVVHTGGGNVTFRMWDVRRGEPEDRYKEACKRMLGFGWCAKKSPEVSSEWDFLLED